MSEISKQITDAWIRIWTSAETPAIAVAGFVGVVAAASTVYQVWRDQRRQKAEERQQRNTLKIHALMFAHEAVELLSRWVQYVEQIHNPDPRVSWSQPFEWVTSEMVSTYVELGGEPKTVEAVYRVKQLNSQVQRQIDRSQDEVLHAIREAPTGTNGQLPTQWQEKLYVVMRPISAFILADNEWPEVVRAVDRLVDSAEKQGNDVRALRGRFLDCSGRGQKFYEQGRTASS